ncbi:hypothetical protein [Robiginitalea aurantiaca]|uniref:Uncharacterized protein n=1 Tax=Robiginitalea aurantiaca TaxID=3056915 RepID=A0ABT7WAY2_9FLAO|nr:hypothetical protein [Robiginitalea aurantiaca]MDM9630077.1 hypothetical protein [Robiginitalea aurantiaca]
MSRPKRHWLLNLLIIFSVILSVLAFAAHARNWKRIKEDRVQLLSGFYYEEIGFSEIDSMSWKDQIPQMERDHGFSFWAREKGRFKDSLYPERPILVFVDDLRQPKLKISYRDSLSLYLNFPDSLETRAMYELLLRKTNGTEPIDE